MNTRINVVFPIPILSPITKKGTLKLQGSNSVHSNWTETGLVNFLSLVQRPEWLGCGVKKMVSDRKSALHRTVALPARAIRSMLPRVWYVQFPSIRLPHGCSTPSSFSTMDVTWGDMSESLTNLKASLWWSCTLEFHKYFVYERRLSFLSVVTSVLVVHSRF